MALTEATRRTSTQAVPAPRRPVVAAGSPTPPARPARRPWRAAVVGTVLALGVACALGAWAGATAQTGRAHAALAQAHLAQVQEQIASARADAAEAASTLAQAQEASTSLAAQRAEGARAGLVAQLAQARARATALQAEVDRYRGEDTSRHSDRSERSSRS